MGFLDKVASAVGSVAKPIAGIIGIGQQEGEQEAIAKAQGTQDALAQKRLEYQRKLSKEASDFRDKLPGYKNEAFNIQEDSAKLGLAKDLSDVRKDANSRGLLYSGIRQGAEADTLANFYADQSSERAKINQGAEDIARGMEEKALGVGLLGQQEQQALNDRAYDMALQQRAARGSGVSKLMGVGGGLLGGMAGKKGPSTGESINTAAGSA